MKLIQEQVDLLNIELEKCKADREAYLDENSEIRQSVFKGQIEMNRYQYMKKVAELSKRIDEINYLFETAEIVEFPNCEMVDIGSKLRMFMNYGEDTEVLDVTFIETKVTCEASDSYLVQDSDFGRAVFHKKVGDVFFYPLPNGMIAQGTILEFKNEKTSDLIIKKSK